MLFYLENIQKVELITEAQADMNPEKTRERFHDLTLLSASERNYPASPAEAKLEAFNNVYADRDYVIEFDCPEYTSLCPVTGQPDFGHIIVRYVPDKKCIESKSLKLYLYSFRNTNTFHARFRRAQNTAPSGAPFRFFAERRHSLRLFLQEE